MTVQYEADVQFKRACLISWRSQSPFSLAKDAALVSECHRPLQPGSDTPMINTTSCVDRLILSSSLAERIQRKGPPQDRSVKFHSTIFQSTTQLKHKDKEGALKGTFSFSLHVHEAAK